ncbi:MAG: Fe-S cluster assembly protein SufD [Flavobacteriales bacterium]
MDVITAVDQKKEAFVQGLDTACKRPLAPASLLAEARGFVEALPVPTTRTEAWKYTRVARIVAMNLQRIDEAVDVAPYLLPVAGDAARLVLVNGRFRADLSILPKQAGIHVQPLEDALQAGLATGIGTLSNQSNDFFEAVNLAYAESGVYIRAAKGSIIESPVYIVHLSSGQQTPAVSRTVIEVEERASLNVIWHTAAVDGTSAFSSHVAECFVGKNARLEIDKVQDEAGEVFQHATEWVAQERDSRFDIRTVTLRGAWVRNNLNVRINGENCSTNLFGTYMPIGKELIDNHTMLDHRVPHCESNETYKGFLNDKSTGVFNGKVFVRQDAQKTNAYQQNSNIVLSDDATMNAKPELEIYADDVKCSHGSTTGQLDEEALFYLRARGLKLATARKLLVEAFVGEIIAEIADDGVRDYCIARLHERAGA